MTDPLRMAAQAVVDGLPEDKDGFVDEMQATWDSAAAVEFYDRVSALRAALAEQDALEDRLLTALILAEGAMNNMGDTLNELGVEPDAFEQQGIDRAFAEVRAVLAEARLEAAATHEEDVG